MKFFMEEKTLNLCNFVDSIISNFLNKHVEMKISIPLVVNGSCYVKIRLKLSIFDQGTYRLFVSYTSALGIAP